MRRLVEAMRDREAEEVVLEAEVSNAGALALYESLGFIRDKRLQRRATAAALACPKNGSGWNACSGHLTALEAALSRRASALSLRGSDARLVRTPSMLDVALAGQPNCRVYPAQQSVLSRV